MSLFVFHICDALQLVLLSAGSVMKKVGSFSEEYILEIKNV